MTAKTKAAGLAILGAGLVIGLGIVSIHVPFGRDQGVAAYGATVLANGGALYRDFYHFNLPGIFFAYRLAFLLPLPPVPAVNLLHLLSVLVTYLIVWRAARSHLPPLAATAAAWFYGAFAIVIYTTYWNIAQKDSLAAPFLAAALYSLLRAEGEDDAAPRASFRPLPLLLFGLFAGLAAQFKPTLGIVVLAALPLILRARRDRRAAQAAALPAAGFAAAFLPLVIYLTASGVWWDMLASVVKFGGYYGGQNYRGFFGTAFNAAWKLLGWAYAWRFLVVLGLIGAAAGLGRRGPRVALLFFALLLVEVVAQMKFFTYHWVPLLVPLSILAAGGASVLLAAPASRPGPRRWALALLLLALFLGNLGPDAGRYRREFLYDLGRVPRDNFLAPYGKWGSGDLSPLASAAVAKYLSNHAPNDDRILVFGLEPGLYVAAGRFPPTRFAYDQPLVTETGGDADFSEYRDGLRLEFLRDLELMPPAYIVIIENDATGVESKDSAAQAREFTAFSALLDRDYTLETKIEDYFIYRRLTAPGGR